MKGKLEDWWWIWGAVLIFTWFFPLLTAMIFPAVPVSPCVESVFIECDEWSPECNINETVELVSGPFFDETVEEVEIYKKEVCIEHENGTRVMPR